MPQFDQIREKELIELARLRFDADLSEAERKILHDSASSEDLPEPDENALKPVVRAEFLRWLATDPETAPHIDSKGLRVYAATIPGKLDFEECHVNPTLDFRRCEFQGEINLLSAETRGLYFFDSLLIGGIRADGVIVHGPLFLRRIHSKGEIRLLGAKITGVLDCSGAKLKAKGDALNADRAQIGGDVFLADNFESDGTIRLLGAQITGNLDCSGAKLKTKDYALNAVRAKISGDVFLNDQFESEGKIHLLGAEITGNLECSGAKLKAKEEALNADRAKIGGNAFFNDQFESEGEIRLLGAQITGNLACSGAKLKAKGNALSADRATISGDVFLDENFESEGTIRLLGAQIGGDLSIRGAKVAKVSCQNTVIKCDLHWQHIAKSPKTFLLLVGAKVRNLRDDQESWPEQGNLFLDGLAYEELTLHRQPTIEEINKSELTEELELNVEERIEWLMLQPEEWLTEAQPWMFLSKHLEGKGDRKGAKHVVFAYRCLLARKHWRLWRWWDCFFAWMEENPLRIGWLILLTMLFGTSVFWWGGSKQAMKETIFFQPNAYTENGGFKPIPALYPKFQPFVYTLENAVPLIKLGMDEKWAPDPSPKFCQPWFPKICGLYFVSTYGVLVFARWALIVWGWIQATILAASVAERFKK